MPVGSVRFAPLAAQTLHKNLTPYQAEGLIMNHDEYMNKLAGHLDPEALERILGEAAPTVTQPEAPLDNFFADDFFTLLYRSEDPSTYPLNRIKEQLLAVSDPGRPRHVRAAAALALGRFIESRYPD